jgi:hypothetical protein
MMHKFRTFKFSANRLFHNVSVFRNLFPIYVDKSVSLMYRTHIEYNSASTMESQANWMEN